MRKLPRFRPAGGVGWGGEARGRAESDCLAASRGRDEDGRTVGGYAGHAAHRVEQRVGGCLALQQLLERLVMKATFPVG